jgi:hypothetical protein
MLFFLRKIRRKLLANNKVATYLLYAIGEIFLVVVGILIALQIDNWNEGRNDRKKELTYLQNILTDLKNDKVKLIEIIERREDKARSSDIMQGYHKGKPIEKFSDYYFHWTNVLYWEFHHPRKTTFEELVNSGNMSIIKNLQIKNLLLEIDVSYEELFDVRKHMYDDYKLYLYAPYADIINYDEGIEVWSNPAFTIQLSEERVKMALKIQAIKNGFTLAAFNNRGLKEKSQQILEKVESAISIIEFELLQ